jgi:hypothetical protein
MSGMMFHFAPLLRKKCDYSAKVFPEDSPESPLASPATFADIATCTPEPCGEFSPLIPGSVSFPAEEAKPSGEVCRFFLKGMCKFGKKCKNLHRHECQRFKDGECKKTADECPYVHSRR